MSDGPSHEGVRAGPLASAVHLFAVMFQFGGLSVALFVAAEFFMDVRRRGGVGPTPAALEGVPLWAMAAALVIASVLCLLAARKVIPWLLRPSTSRIDSGTRPVHFSWEGEHAWWTRPFTFRTSGELTIDDRGIHIREARVHSAPGFLSLLTAALLNSSYPLYTEIGGGPVLPPGVPLLASTGLIVATLLLYLVPGPPTWFPHSRLQWLFSRERIRLPWPDVAAVHWERFRLRVRFHPGVRESDLILTAAPPTLRDLRERVASHVPVEGGAS
ncbi:MAG: hypothetical protein ACYTDX_06635 [Planctomycetota bacterium]|jgi:hypothetical protein